MIQDFLNFDTWKQFKSRLSYPNSLTNKRELKVENIEKMKTGFLYQKSCKKNLDNSCSPLRAYDDKNIAQKSSQCTMLVHFCSNVEFRIARDQLFIWVCL